MRSPRYWGVKGSRNSVAAGSPRPQTSSRNSASLCHTALDVVGAVQCGVVDISLPAECRPRLFEVDSHGDEDQVIDLSGQLCEPAGVLTARLRVVDRARAYDHKHPLVLAGEDPFDHVPVAGDLTLNMVRVGIPLPVLGRRRQRRYALDTHVLKLRNRGLYHCFLPLLSSFGPMKNQVPSRCRLGTWCLVLVLMSIWPFAPRPHRQPLCR